MKRQKYHGFVIDTDNLGRVYIYNTESPYSEDSDRKVIGYATQAEARRAVDREIKFIEAERAYFESIGRED